MPLPAPEKNEKKDDFLSRCMLKLDKEYPDSKQRYAICMKQWNEKEKK